MQIDPTDPWGRLARAAAAVALAGVLAACSSGPTDFVDLAGSNFDTPPPPQVKTEGERAALTHDLTATGSRVSARGAAADDGLPSAMALAVIRQQQNEDAKALLAEASASTVAPAKPACADGRPPDAEGRCARP